MNNQDIIFCPNCGSKNDKNAKFCVNCGNSLMDVQQQINQQVQQSDSNQQVQNRFSNQIENKQIPRKFNFFIVSGLIGCFFMPPILIMGVIILISYLINGNEITGLGKFLKIVGIIFLYCIVAILLGFGACAFLITGMY